MDLLFIYCIPNCAMLSPWQRARIPGYCRQSSSFKDFVENLQKSKLPSKSTTVIPTSPIPTPAVQIPPKLPTIAQGTREQSSKVTPVNNSSAAFKTMLANMTKTIPSSAIGQANAKPALSSTLTSPTSVSSANIVSGLQKFKVSIAEHQKQLNEKVSAVSESAAIPAKSKFEFSSVSPTFSARSLGMVGNAGVGNAFSKPTQDMQFGEFIKKRAEEKLNNVSAATVTAPKSRKSEGNLLSVMGIDVDMTSVRKIYNDRLLRKTSSAGVNASVKMKESPRKTVVKVVSIPAEGITLRELASRLSMKLDVLSSKLVSLGEGADDGSGPDRIIDADIAELVVLEMGLNVKRLTSKVMDLVSVGKKSDRQAAKFDSSAHPLLPRAPVVCIMGHVDHGKTTLLDSLRKANIAATEAGGITQKLSAFCVPIRGKEVVFLDTPGHQAFSAMRVNGAMATDVAVLVIAMDDGVRPQTIEALNTAKEAGCHILIALNKIDRIPVAERAAARARVLSQLVPLGLVVEEYGGDSPVVEVAGRTGEGIENLLDILSLQTDVLELKAPIEGNAEATVLDSNMEKGKGVVADILVRWGSLHIGDYVVVGTAYGKVKSMINGKGEYIKTCPPSTPVQLLGLRTVPAAGQELLVVPSEAKAKEITERRIRVQALRQQVQSKDLSIVQEEEFDENGYPIVRPSAVLAHINVILKADGVGTLKALVNVVNGIKEKCSNGEVTIVASGVGDVSQSDIDRASFVGSTSAATCVLAFNVAVSDAMRQAAKELDVRICRETIIYRLEDELTSIMTSLMPKERHVLDEGVARILQVFPLNDKSGDSVAGLEVKTGRLKTSGSQAQYIYRVLRNGALVKDELEAEQLKRFKNVVHEVDHGNECGLKLKGFNEFEVGDIIECKKIEMRPRALKMDKLSLSAAAGVSAETIIAPDAKQQTAAKKAPNKLKEAFEAQIKSKRADDDSSDEDDGDDQEGNRRTKAGKQPRSIPIVEDEFDIELYEDAANEGKVSSGFRDKKSIFAVTDDDDIDFDDGFDAPKGTGPSVKRFRAAKPSKSEGKYKPKQFKKR